MNGPPVLAPVFAAVVADLRAEAGEIPVVVERTLDETLKRIRGELAELAGSAPELYGVNAGGRTDLRVITDVTGGLARIAAGISASGGFTLFRLYHDGRRVADSGEASETPRDIILPAADATATASSLQARLREECAVAFADIVVVLWNDAGTCNAGLLRQALLWRKPVLRIDANGARSLIDIDRFDLLDTALVEAGDMSAEWLDRLFQPLGDEILRRELCLIANPLDSRCRVNVGEGFMEGLRGQFRGGGRLPWLRRWAGRLDRSASALLRGSGLGKAFRHDPTRTWFGVGAADLPQAESVPMLEPEGLEERFRWCDARANVTAGAHRDTAWVLYLLAAFAVFAAVAGSLDLFVPHGSLFWPAAELVAIVGILGVFWLASQRNWHGRWLANRFVAEQLRYMRAIYPLLCFLDPAVAVDRRKRPGGDGGSTLLSPEAWIIRRIIVAAGPPALKGAKAFRPVLLAGPCRDYVAAVIRSQVSYQRRNQHDLHVLAHRLHLATWLTFTVTAAAVVAHFFLHAAWLLLFTAALPAVAAAIHGIMTANELERVASMSAETATDLEPIADALQRIDLHVPDSRDWLLVRELARRAAQIMSGNNRQWQDLLQLRSTGLPA